MHARHKKILDMLERGRLTIKEASLELGVAEMTLRRDLKLLEKSGALLQVRGGAVLPPARYEPESSVKGELERKFALAEALYKKIMPAETLFIGTGSTVLAFAKYLARHNTLPVTVITNSLPVASSLFKTHCHVILPGGELRSNSLDLVGPVAERNMEDYHVDYLISGCDAASSGYGFYTSDMNLSNLEKKSIRIADRTAIITASGKFRKKALTRFAAREDVDLLVTDTELSREDEKELLPFMEIIKADAFEQKKQPFVSKGKEREKA
ncbi:MAG: DeoR/GlpR transcriptional regulator [Lentisphaeria bacterium]|nr:DeoR/GlpR transcriptional regulator [Lentisphaeria bacterium]